MPIAVTYNIRYLGCVIRNQLMTTCLLDCIDTVAVKYGANDLGVCKNSCTHMCGLIAVSVFPQLLVVSV